MQDVLTVLNEVKVLMAKIPRGHPLAQENFLQVAMRILTIDSCATDSNRQRSFCGTSIFRETSTENSKAIAREREPTLTTGTTENPEGNRLFEKRKIVPMQTLGKGLAIGVFDGRTIRPEVDNRDLYSIFSQDERASFIKKSTQVVFITEYVVLVEFVEVVLPIVSGKQQNTFGL